MQQKVITPIRNYVNSNNNSGGDSGNTGNQVASQSPPRVLTETERHAEWNASYSDLIAKVGDCESIEARSTFVKNHQEELARYRDSKLPVDDHLKYLCVTIDGQILPNKNGQLLTGNEAWEYNYNDLMGKIAKCNSMDARSELAIKHQDELAKYRDSKLPVDNDLEYLHIGPQGQKLLTDTEVTQRGRYEKLIGAIANCKTMSDREEMVKNNSLELDYARKWGANVTNDLEYLIPPKIQAAKGEESIGDIVKNNANLIGDGAKIGAKIITSGADTLIANEIVSAGGLTTAVTGDLQKGMAVAATGLTVKAGLSYGASVTKAFVVDTINGTGDKAIKELNKDWKENPNYNVFMSNFANPSKKILTDAFGKTGETVVTNYEKEGVKKIKNKLEEILTPYLTPPPAQEKQLNFHANLDGSSMKSFANSAGTTEVNKTKGQEKPQSGETSSKDTTINPTKIGELRRTLNGQMDEIIKQQKDLGQQRDQVEGAPLTKEQAEKLAASNHLNGADKELDKQVQELQAKRDKLSQHKEDIIKYGKENGLDTTLWRYAPEIFKGEGLKYYESSMAAIEHNHKFYNGQETALKTSRDQLEARLQTPEAKSEIAKNSEEILAQDKERLVNLEGLDQKINELTNEKHDIMRLRDVIPSRKLDREIDVQGDPKNVQNLLSQTDQLKQQAAEMQQAQAQSCGQSM